MNEDAIQLASDDELVARAQGRDDEAFQELMRRTESSSLRLATTILRDRSAAEDEVQNAYLNAWRHVGKFEGHAQFSTWISRIVVNQCLMRLRAVRRAKLISLDRLDADGGRRQMQMADPGLSPEAHLGKAQRSGVLAAQIQRLPPVLRRVLVLRDLHEFPTAAVAGELGISVAAVKSRLVRARLALQKRMEVLAIDSARASAI